MKKKVLISLLALSALTALSSCSFIKSIIDGVVDNLPPGEYNYYELGQRSAKFTFYGKSVGNTKTLVVPVIIKGYSANANETNRERIRKAFFGTSEETGWESVSSYFYKSSYGKMNLSGEVTEWFDSGLTPEQIYSRNSRYDDLGTMYVLDRVYDWLVDKGYNLSEYDVDGDGWIDSIWMIYSCPSNTKVMGTDDNLFWAFTFWDYNNMNAPHSKSKPLPNTYAWASYDFMNEGTSSAINIDAHTYIHEFGHTLGLDDYYDYDQKHSPLGGIDMQDWNIGDHNAFSKYAWGWVDPIIIDKEQTVTIHPTSASGDCILIPNNYSWSGCPFNEYIMIDFVDNKNLWEKDSKFPYDGVHLTYTRPGLRIMHVDARLGKYDLKEGTIESVTNKMNFGEKYGLAYSNTPSYSFSQGNISTSTKMRIYDDLISIVNKNHNTDVTHKYSTSATNNSLFFAGDAFNISDYKDFFYEGRLHKGTISYRLEVVSLNGEEAVIKFIKR